MRGHYNRKPRGSYESDDGDYFSKPAKPIYRRIGGRVVRMEPLKPDRKEDPTPNEYAVHDNAIYADTYFAPSEICTTDENKESKVWEFNERIKPRGVKNG